MSNCAFFFARSRAVVMLLGLVFLLSASSVRGLVDTGFQGGNNAPAIVYWNHAWRIFYRNNDGALSETVSNDGGNTWIDFGQLGYQTSAGPGVIASVDGSQLHIFLRDPNGNGILHLIGYTGGGGFNQANPYYIRQDMDNGPVAAVAQFGQYQGRICVVGSQAGGSNIVYSTLNADSSLVGQGNAQWNQQVPPTIVWFASTGQFHIFFTTPGKDQIYRQDSFDGINWSNIQSVATYQAQGYLAGVITSYNSQTIFHLFAQVDGGGLGIVETSSSDLNSYSFPIVPVSSLPVDRVAITAATQPNTNSVLLAFLSNNEIYVYQGN